MSIASQLKIYVAHALQQLLQDIFEANELVITPTKDEFEGDYTFVTFAIIKKYKLAPQQLGEQLGDKLLELYPHYIKGYNVIKGFLNIHVQESVLHTFLNAEYNNEKFGRHTAKAEQVVVEYSSPNTNKPLHLGHLRNIFLGWSVAEILEANGYDVIKTSVVNDRGIHICKSMIAWETFAEGATPQSTGIKGDHLVGDYYVKFNDAYTAQVKELEQAGMAREQAEKEAPLMKQAQQMLLKWEQGDTAVLDLWRSMNSWVYAGFDETYKTIGVRFDKNYYESSTYLLGKEFVQQGLEKGVFYKREDGSVWVDLTADGLDEKLLLRRDGTSVYMTQDLGLADEKYEDFKYTQSIYVIADEQNYHMKVLKLILQKLGKPYAGGIYHLSYGMVELPSGKMKSREGTVVDADDIVEQMKDIARVKTEELGKVADFTQDELSDLYRVLGLGALKFFLLRVDPKKKMVFNPQESIEFQGFTGPFIQYTYARIQSIRRKNSLTQIVTETAALDLQPKEKELVFMLEQFPTVIQDAGLEHNPSLLAIYLFNLAQAFNSFYAVHSIANAETESHRQFRLKICSLTANVIRQGMDLLGIDVPQRM